MGLYFQGSAEIFIPCSVMLSWWIASNHKIYKNFEPLEINHPYSMYTVHMSVCVYLSVYVPVHAYCDCASRCVYASILYPVIGNLKKYVLTLKAT